MSSKKDLRSLIGLPSAFVPIAMSLGAFTMVVGYVLIYGAARLSDEGAAAHVWQLLICAQMPFVGFFVIRWLPRAPQAALRVLALQFGAVLAALSPVYFLHL